MVIGMNQAVIIKSNKNGITLILKEDLDFPVLLEEILKKFKASEKFFSDTGFAVMFEGRRLSDAEKYEIVDSIMAQTSIQILCILESDELRDDLIRRKIEEQEQRSHEKQVNGSFYHGNLKTGERLETDKSIIIIGDVPKGACVFSKSDIIVLGNLSGCAHAGADGAEDAFIAALGFAPEEYSIGNICGKPLPKERGGFFSKRNKTPTARIAAAEGGFITVKPLMEGLYNII